MVPRLSEVFLLELEDPYATKEVRLPSGDVLQVSFVNKGNHAFEAEIGFEGGESVGSVEVDYWPQRKLAYVYLATMRSRWQGKGVGTAVYPLVNQEVERRWNLPLSSDKDGSRSEAAERLWQRLIKKGMAKKVTDRFGDRYVMTRKS